MDVKHINPFIKAFSTVIPQIGFKTVEKGKLGVKNKEFVCSGVIILLGLAGDIEGNVAFHTSVENAKVIASAMMKGAPISEFDDMAQSAVAELANMITANATIHLSESKVNADISTPTLLKGENMSIKMSSKQVLCIDFLIDGLSFDINIAFS